MSVKERIVCVLIAILAGAALVALASITDREAARMKAAPSITDRFIEVK